MMRTIKNTFMAATAVVLAAPLMLSAASAQEPTAAELNAQQLAAFRAQYSGPVEAQGDIDSSAANNATGAAISGANESDAGAAEAADLNQNEGVALDASDDMPEQDSDSDPVAPLNAPTDLSDPVTTPPEKMDDADNTTSRRPAPSINSEGDPQETTIDEATGEDDPLNPADGLSEPGLPSPDDPADATENPAEPLN